MPSYQFEGHSVGEAPKKSGYSKNENHSHSANYSRYYRNPTAKSKPTYVGYEYPDGTYSLGRVSEKKGKTEKEYDYEVNKLYEVVEWSEPDPAEYLGYKDRVGSRFLDDKAKQYERSLYSKLDPPEQLSQDTTRKRTRYGKNGITRKGRQRVKAGATLLERKYGKQRLGLFTLTLPSENQGVDGMDLYYICWNWSLFQKRFLQELTRMAERKGAPTPMIAVTEFQEKRYEKYGEPAPHLHILFVCSRSDSRKLEKKEDYYLDADELRAVVKRVLTNFLDPHGEGKEINCNNTVNLQRIRKSASGYLSKYMSKGGEILQKLQNDGLEDCIPNQWWSPIGGMRDWIKANIRKISSKVANFLATAKQGDDGIDYVKQISTALDNSKELVVGIYVRVSRELFEFLSETKWSEPLE